MKLKKPSITPPHKRIHDKIKGKVEGKLKGAGKAAPQAQEKLVNARENAKPLPRIPGAVKQPSLRQDRAQDARPGGNNWMNTRTKDKKTTVTMGDADNDLKITEEKGKLRLKDATTGQTQLIDPKGKDQILIDGGNGTDKAFVSASVSKELQKKLKFEDTSVKRNKPRAREPQPKNPRLQGAQTAPKAPAAPKNQAAPKAAQAAPKAPKADAPKAAQPQAAQPQLRGPRADLDQLLQGPDRFQGGQRQELQGAPLQIPGFPGEARDGIPRDGAQPVGQERLGPAKQGGIPHGGARQGLGGVQPEPFPQPAGPTLPRQPGGIQRPDQGFPGGGGIQMPGDGGGTRPLPGGGVRPLPGRGFPGGGGVQLPGDGRVPGATTPVIPPQNPGRDPVAHPKAPAPTPGPAPDQGGIQLPKQPWLPPQDPIQDKPKAPAPAPALPKLPPLTGPQTPQPDPILPLAGVGEPAPLIQPLLGAFGPAAPDTTLDPNAVGVVAQPDLTFGAQQPGLEQMIREAPPMARTPFDPGQITRKGPAKRPPADPSQFGRKAK